MKSLKDNPSINVLPEIFTPEIISWLEREGFETSTNDSYCDKLSDEPFEPKCFYKNASDNGTYFIGVYVFSYGVGVDIDYDCGGNSNAMMWLFKNYTFEAAYDEMVDYVNSYKN